ncbi:3265_t:CDS:2 [Entrophospora sp. SA101]|nr:3265_t:CDS:2 [Entrophospora sp. SA101]
MLSNGLANKINQALAVVKMLTLIVIIIIGFVQLIRTDISKPNWQNPFQDIENLKLPNLASALISVFFAYNGWNNLNYSLDEFKDPKGKLVYSNSLSVTVVTILYALTNVAFITVVKSEDVNKPGKDFNELIAGTFAKEIGGEDFARVLSFFVALSAFGAVSSMTWRFHHKRYTPYNALLVQFVWCVMVFVILGGAFSSDAFKLLSDFATYFAWIFYFLASVGLLWLRYKEPEILRPFKVWIVLTVILVCSAIFIIIGNAIELDMQPTHLTPNAVCQEDAKTIKNYIKSIICIGCLIVGTGCWYVNDFYIDVL